MIDLSKLSVWIAAAFAEIETEHGPQPVLQHRLHGVQTEVERIKGLKAGALQGGGIPKPTSGTPPQAAS
jgi:hypothetical protein